MKPSISNARCRFINNVELDMRSLVFSVVVLLLAVGCQKTNHNTLEDLEAGQARLRSECTEIRELTDVSPDELEAMRAEWSARYARWMGDIETYIEQPYIKVNRGSYGGGMNYSAEVTQKVKGAEANRLRERASELPTAMRPWKATCGDETP